MEISLTALLAILATGAIWWNVNGRSEFIS